MAVRSGKRVYYLKQLKAPDEDRRQSGLYRVDGGGGDVFITTAGSVEEIAYNLSRKQPPKSEPEPAPW